MNQRRELRGGSDFPLGLRGISRDDVKKMGRLFRQDQAPECEPNPLVYVRYSWYKVWPCHILFSSWNVDQVGFDQPDISSYPIQDCSNPSRSWDFHVCLVRTPSFPASMEPNWYRETPDKFIWVFVRYLNCKLTAGIFLIVGFATLFSLPKKTVYVYELFRRWIMFYLVIYTKSMN